MDHNTFKNYLLQEEQCAHIRGWNFSHILGRYEIDSPPWDYRKIVTSYLSPDDKLLDIDTGGGEFLLSLRHPFENTSATEGYPPNVKLCESTLRPLGIDFRKSDDPSRLPFESGVFDIIINRHGSFDPLDLFRLLKPGGIIITQQVGAENDRGLVDLLLPGTELPYPDQYLEKIAQKFAAAGFYLLQQQEAFPAVKFYDAGALVWFAHIIEWEFPGFSVDACFDRLCQAQRILEKTGAIEASAHRFLLAAQKPTGH